MGPPRFQKGNKNVRILTEIRDGNAGAGGDALGKSPSPESESFPAPGSAITGPVAQAPPQVLSDLWVPPCGQLPTSAPSHAPASPSPASEPHQTTAFMCHSLFCPENPASGGNGRGIKKHNW